MWYLIGFGIWFVLALSVWLFLIGNSDEFDHGRCRDWLPDVLEDGESRD